MSIFSFATQMGIAKAGKLGDTLTVALANGAPDLANQIDMDKQIFHLNEVGGKLSDCEIKIRDQTKIVADISTKNNRQMQAASILEGQINAAADEATKLAKNNALNTVLNDIEESSAELTAAQKILSEEQSDLAEWTQVHNHLSDQIKTAKARGEADLRALSRAQEDAARQAERAEQAKHDAGLKAGLDTGNIAHAAIQRATEEAQKKARTAELLANSLKGAAASSSDDIVSQALASQTSTPSSALERLAAMRAKQSVPG